MSVTSFIKQTFPRFGKFVSDKKTIIRFIRDGKLMMKFMKEANFPAHQNFRDDDGIIWFVVTPWMYTAAPWYAIAIALMVSLRNVKVGILWDDLVHDDIVLDIAGSSTDQNKVIEKVLSLLPKSIPLIKIAHLQKSDLLEEDEIELRKLARSNAIHRFRSSIPSKERVDYEKRWYNLQRNNLMILRTLFKSLSFKRLVVPGGVYGNSGLYVYLANNLHTITTYDAGDCRALICVNGIAGYQGDIPVSLKTDEIDSMSSNFKSRAIELAQNELKLRMEGNDAYLSQVNSFNNSEHDGHYDIIMPLNITWDLPALGKHTLFEDDFDWVVETVKFILSETSASVAVRQHPHERRMTSGRDFRDEIVRIFGSSNRFRFFACDDPVNTYAMVSKAKIILPYASTIGIEAALMGKTVIMESDCYYSEFCFVKRTYSRNEYFNTIRSCLKAPLLLGDEQLNSAWLCYYVTQLCNVVETEFTPFANNFRYWVEKGLHVLNEDESVQMIVKSIAEQVPVVLLNHRKHMANA